MRTVSHKLMATMGTTTVMLVMANNTSISLLGVLAGISGGMASGTAPDKLEYLALGIRWIKHRTLTHWPALWFGLISFSLYLAEQIGDIAYGLTGYGLGALFQILGDWCTPKGIPFWLPNQKSMRSGRLVKSEKHEFFVVLIFCLISGIVCKFQLAPFIASLPEFSFSSLPHLQ
jgi:membrane-bound metal-dependent hydrolase YbcI (DUF457 family)